MKKKFNVTGMTCAACRAHVKKAVESLEGIESVNVNLLQNTMDVSYKEDVCSIKNIVDAVSKAGYKASLPKEKIEIKEKDNSLLNLIISIIFLFILMYFSMGHMMWGWPIWDIFNMHYSKMGFALIQFLLVLPIIYINRGYFIRGYKRLFKGPTMDSLIAVGATASILYSIYALFSIAYDPSDSKMLHMSLYFEAAGMILVFVSLGKYLENLSKKKTSKSLESLYSLAPKNARLLKNGIEVIVGVEDIHVGDIVIIKKGDVIPVDGIVKKGNASINQANITGESIPVYKVENEILYSLTTVENGYIEMEATKVNEDSTFAHIIHLVEEAANSKAPISKLADKIAGIFVPIIFIIAILVFIANFLYVQFNNLDYVTTNAFEVAFNYAITVIVIACPCALGLATPVAIMVGTGKGAENGLIIKNAEILERTGKIDTVVFDKTGTITSGHPIVTDITINDEILSKIYSIELLSNHPLSKAIIEYAENKNLKKYLVKDYQALDGMGLMAKVVDNEYYIGIIKGINEPMDYSNLEDEGKTVLYIKENDNFLGIIVVRDEVKENSKEAISLLKDMNINVVMLTGDNEKTANAISKMVGIDTVISNLLPSQKAEVIDSLKKDGKLVSMVGDSVNDAVALAKSDLGIAIGSGSEAIRENSDIVLVRNDILDVVNAIMLSKRTVFTIKLGLFWAFFYNFICVILATGIFYHISKGSFQMKPEYGSIAMSISSVSVVLNALSINFFKLKRSKNIIEEKKEEEEIMNKVVIPVEGMMSKHCKAHVEEACKNVLGVEDAVASLEDKNVTVTLNKDVSIDTLKNAINEAGYEAK
jgi:Cu+-exporting ATPase